MPDTLKQKSDEELLLSYQKDGDKLLVGELFKRHSLMCFAVCNKYLKNEDAAQDAVMQIFENLFEDLKKHTVLNFRTWLHSVARNYCLMILRKPELLLRLSEEDEESEESFMEKQMILHPLDNKLELEEKLSAMELALLNLPAKQQECIRLFYLNQLSYEQVSTQTGYSLNEVKSFIQNGKRNLKISLAQKGISLVLACIVWIQQSA
ncbi:MAG: RNA polymerase subunit sigma-24 [Bacteroidetes bacterium B1(2017)]|nr:MAG: RNA polymerase subunit sigma-24 [Bacteroidetes bacterium B1(2017)]